MTRKDDPKDLHVESMRENNSETLIYRIWVILSGNGDPKEGLMWKVSELMSFKDNVRGAMNKIVWSAIIGTSSIVALFLWTVLKDQILRGKL